MVSATTPQFWPKSSEASIIAAKVDCLNNMITDTANAKAIATISTDSPTDDITNWKRLLPNILRVLMLRRRNGTIAKKGYDPQYGARPLRRVITSMVEDRFSEAMLDGIVKPGHLAIIDAVETTDPDALLAQGAAAEDGKVIVIKDGGELEISSNPVIEKTAGNT